LEITPKYVFHGTNNLPVTLLGNYEQYAKDADKYSWIEIVYIEMIDRQIADCQPLFLRSIFFYPYSQVH